jgi:hypothetical protein
LLLPCASRMWPRRTCQCAGTAEMLRNPGNLKHVNVPRYMKPCGHAYATSTMYEIYGRMMQMLHARPRMRSVRAEAQLYFRVGLVL